jgi:hypothetical protein
MHDRTVGVFSRTLMIGTWVGLGVLVLFGGAYLAGFRSFVEIEAAAQNWDKPVSQFWLSVHGEQIRGYGWFFSRLWRMDSASMVGILLLVCTPLMALTTIMWSVRRLYLILILILIVEYLFSLFSPVL